MGDQDLYMDSSGQWNFLTAAKEKWWSQREESQQSDLLEWNAILSTKEVHVISGAEADAARRKWPDQVVSSHPVCLLTDTLTQIQASSIPTHPLHRLRASCASSRRASIWRWRLPSVTSKTLSVKAIGFTNRVVHFMQNLVRVFISHQEVSSSSMCLFMGWTTLQQNGAIRFLSSWWMTWRW